MEPFITSAIKNCPGAEIVLFVDDISEFTREKLQRCEKVIYVDIPAYYKNVLIIHSRWRMCADFLEQFGEKYEQVFVTDTRDVIFQGDVFEAFENHKNYLGYTTEAQLIDNDRVNNYRWIESCFSKAEADKLADKKAICCGTVIGTVNEMKIFCGIMWDNLKAKVSWGHEQAMMNYLVYENLLPIKNLLEIDAYSGAILTNAAIKESKFLGDKILLGDGGIPAVVHQYDRHAPQVQLVDNIYRDKNFQADERFTDSRSVLEQIFCLLQVNKADDAAQFCMKNFSPELNRGENIYCLLKMWSFLFQKSLTPSGSFIGVKNNAAARNVVAVHKNESPRCLKCSEFVEGNFIFELENNFADIIQFERGRIFLKLTIQSALKFAQGFSLNPLVKICSLLIHSIKNGRGVDFEFKFTLINFLLNVVEQTIQANNAEFCFHFINVIKSFELPPDKDFYLLEAKANRTFGRKEEALASYKKALDLS